MLLAVLLIEAVPELLRHRIWGFSDSEWIDPLLIVIDTALAVGALLHHYGNSLAFAEHAKQYAHMSKVLGRAFENLKDLQQANEMRAAVSCLKKIGVEALSENANWVMLHRERPLEVPHP